MANTQPKMEEYTIQNEAEMVNIARDLWENLQPNLGKSAIIIGLKGPLGAGKTTFIKLLAKEAGVPEEMVSPTYVLHIPHSILYSGNNVQLQHIDAWRMEEFGELEQIGIKKMITDKDLVVIEWADKFEKEIKRLSNLETKIIWVKIKYGKEENERVIKVVNDK